MIKSSKRKYIITFSKCRLLICKIYLYLGSKLTCNHVSLNMTLQENVMNFIRNFSSIPKFSVS